MKVAIVGATGAVGRTMLKVLEERDFPVSRLKLFASERSAGTVLKFKDEMIGVNVIKPDSFEDCDIALFSAGSGVSRTAAPLAVESGCFVVDNSSQWRMDVGVPLIVPEVNGILITDKDIQPIIIANPNCSTIQLVTALDPIHRVAGIERIIVDALQAVSGAGEKAVRELEFETQRKLEGIFIPEQNPQEKVFAHQIAFNCIPHIGGFLENAYTEEEMKLVNETQKIMRANIAINATCIRVPVLNGHAESVKIQTKKEMRPDEVRQILAEAPGIKILDDPQNNEYPLQVNANGTDDVYVGRIRKDDSAPNALNMWIVADNLRKGAATNAVQIAELIAQRHFN